MIFEKVVNRPRSRFSRNCQAPVGRPRVTIYATLNNKTISPARKFHIQWQGNQRSDRLAVADAHDRAGGDVVAAGVGVRNNRWEVMADFEKRPLPT